MSNVNLNYQLLGRSGLRVSELCLGTMTFGEDFGWGASADESRQVYDAFREAGGNFLDTANIYTNGSSEKLIGEFTRGHREEVVIATKYTNAIGALLGGGRPDPNAAGNQRKNMVQAVEASLKRLGTDYIDLYWVHIWDQLTPAEEVMRALDDLVRAGKVLYVGISDAPAWVVARSNTLAELRGWTSYVGLQIEYSLLERTVERELVPMARDQGLTITAWSPLKNGVLTGKYLPEHAARSEQEGARLHSEMMRGFGLGVNDTETVVREVVKVAQELEATPAQVALAWLREQSVIPIIGARKAAQIKDNLAAVNVRLTPEQWRRLDEATRIPLGFPHEFYAMDAVKAILYAGLRDRLRV